MRLFRFSGIDVFLHWSWFVVAIYEIQQRAGRYSSIKWNIIEYLGLFLIVLLHEFGHALACRQVGGTANRIVLWPLGGVAYVDPPPRPGAMLWSIVAGPLVNVLLVPVIFGVGYLSRHAGLYLTIPDLGRLLRTILVIDVVLFVFNILPVYPLDGGKILWSLLWFIFGRARSLMIATVLGFVGVIGFIGLAFWSRDVWLGVVAAYMLLNCWGGLKQAQALLKIAKLPRREGFVCPRCKSKPPLGAFWKCNNCQQAFDTFQSGAVCPACSTRFNVTRCLDCGWG
ncbi:MAG TPA: M50 family metallopeptidase, partial [Terriglobales bacterium]|nr:M50 family metallopeptidase [Terriglobales bacterium]